MPVNLSFNAHDPFIYSGITYGASSWVRGQLALDAINHRSIAGAGLGVRYGGEHWSASLVAAWRTRGGAPQSDSAHGMPSVLGNATYRFRALASSA